MTIRVSSAKAAHVVAMGLATLRAMGATVHGKGLRVGKLCTLHFNNTGGDWSDSGSCRRGLQAPWPTVRVSEADSSTAVQIRHRLGCSGLPSWVRTRAFALGSPASHLLADQCRAAGALSLPNVRNGAACVSLHSVSLGA